MVENRLLAETDLSPIHAPYFLPHPALQHRRDIRPFLRRKLSPMRDAVPFLQAPAATASRSVLGDEHRMAAKRRLFAVIGDDRRGKALGDEILGVGKHHRQAFAAQVGELLAAQVKAAAKGGFGQSGKNFVQVSHKAFLSNKPL